MSLLSCGTPFFFFSVPHCLGAHSVFSHLTCLQSLLSQSQLWGTWTAYDSALFLSLTTIVPFMHRKSFQMEHLRIQWVQKFHLCLLPKPPFLLEVPPYFVFQTLNIVVIAEMSCFLNIFVTNSLYIYMVQNDSQICSSLFIFLVLAHPSPYHNGLIALCFFSLLATFP